MKAVFPVFVIDIDESKYWFSAFQVHNAVWSLPAKYPRELENVAVDGTDGLLIETCRCIARINECVCFCNSKC